MDSHRSGHSTFFKDGREGRRDDLGKAAELHGSFLLKVGILAFLLVTLNLHRSFADRRTDDSGTLQAVPKCSRQERSRLARVEICRIPPPQRILRPHH